MEKYIELIAVADALIMMAGNIEQDHVKQRIYALANHIKDIALDIQLPIGVAV